MITLNTAEWKKEAETLFFDHKLNINQISDILGLSRKSISGYLSLLPAYQMEREERKKINKQRRKEYKREWDRSHRAANTLSAKITEDDIKREHEVAVRILSAEKYH